ncbi:hypothetical protein TNCV_3824931 [Trichonephila clavipes]|nr:hypothetical protein TNCV_3824931 [Trichonephila clavipes]
MIGNVFVRHSVEMFTRTLEEADLEAKDCIATVICAVMPSQKYGMFYEYRSRRYAPDLWIFRREYMSSRKIVSRKISTERRTRLPDVH